MTLFSIAPLYRALLCTATFVLFILLAADLFLTFRQKNYPLAGCTALLFILTYAVQQPIKAVIYFYAFGTQEHLARGFVRIPWQLFLVILLLLFAAGLWLLSRCLLWRRNHITAASVKESVDNLPSGLAFYRDDGSCLLVNRTMNQLSAALTGHAVLNGCELQALAEKQGMLADANGRNYQISHRLLTFDQQMIHELIADDVTELYEQIRSLRKGNDELAEMTEKMKQYGLKLDETVRSQEILQAKVQIHDEMNRLLLATSHASSGDVSSEELEKLLNSWKNNALLLCKEAEPNPISNAEQDLETLAKLLNIKIEWSGQLKTRDPAALQLFELCTREALNNAVKHAMAKSLNVKLQETERELTVIYTNDGTPPAAPVHFAGGLKNLKRLLDAADGQISVTSVPNFVLTITIPIGGN